MSDIMKAVEDAYVIYDKSQYLMPTRTQIANGDNTLLLMPCFSKNEYGTKMMNVFPENKDFPVTQGLMVLNNIENGDTKAILNGTTLTALRTGAIGGVAVKYLTAPDVKKVGLIGTGFQGLYQLVAACHARKFEDIYLYNRSPEKIPGFTEKLKKHLPNDVNIHEVDNAESLVRKAEVIMTATTSSDPVLPDKKEPLKGKTVVGVGSFQPSMREFPFSLYELADHMYIDTEDAIEESGDVAQPLKNGWIHESQIVPFSRIVTKKENIAPSRDRSVVFKSTGMALFDVVASQMIYEKAIQNGLGHDIDW